jgi:RNA polymerase sigma factor (TIGR02999 family)
VAFTVGGRDDVTQLLEDAAQGDQQAIRQLLPRVYEELRQLAASQMASEQPGQTLQATALVHEAFLRLMGSGTAVGKFTDRRYFFAAAAQAMQRILIDAARRRKTVKHGGDWLRIDMATFDPAASDDDHQLEQLTKALEALAVEDAEAAELVNLRWFAGRTMPEVAELLGISLRSAERQWAYARAWLFQRLQGME